MIDNRTFRLLMRVASIAVRLVGFAVLAFHSWQLALALFLIWWAWQLQEASKE